MLIDAGNNNDSDLLVNYLKEQGVKNLQYMIGTHPQDHIEEPMKLSTTLI